MTRVALIISLALSSAVLTSLVLPAAAATEQVLCSFKSAALGAPNGKLLLHKGSLFGMASGFAGTDGDGRVGRDGNGAFITVPRTICSRAILGERRTWQ